MTVAVSSVEPLSETMYLNLRRSLSECALDRARDKSGAVDRRNGDGQPWFHAFDHTVRELSSCRRARSKVTSWQRFAGFVLKIQPFSLDH